MNSPSLRVGLTLACGTGDGRGSRSQRVSCFVFLCVSFYFCLGVECIFWEANVRGGGADTKKCYSGQSNLPYEYRRGRVYVRVATYQPERGRGMALHRAEQRPRESLGRFAFQELDAGVLDGGTHVGCGF